MNSDKIKRLDELIRILQSNLSAARSFSWTFEGSSNKDDLAFAAKNIEHVLQYMLQVMQEEPSQKEDTIIEVPVVFDENPLTIKGSVVLTEFDQE